MSDRSVILALRCEWEGAVMSANDVDPVGTLEWPESVALAAMQVALMQSDIGATKSDKSVAIKRRCSMMPSPVSAGWRRRVGRTARNG